MSQQPSSVTRREVKRGETVQYRFTENPSTGFTWQTSVVPPTVTIVKGDYVRGTCPPGAVGCPGSVTFTITFASSIPIGTHIPIKFIYARAGSTDTSSATVNQIDFVITA